MSTEITAKFDRLLEKVRRMRAYQREYFKYRAKSDLDLAKKFEREVDKMVEEEVKIKKSNQQELFNNGTES